MTAFTPPGEAGSPLPETGPWPVMPTGVAVSVQSAGTRPEPDATGSTTFTSVSAAGWSVLVIVQVAASPTLRVTVPAAGSVAVAPVHDHWRRLVPRGSSGFGQGVFADGHDGLGHLESPTRPSIVTAPVADRSQSVGCAEPPEVFVTSLTSVRVGAHRGVR